MILDVFKYYAGFPKLEGVKSIFAQGRSDRLQYSKLQEFVDNMAVHSRLNIDNYVFGQSYDAVKARIDQLLGTYLFVEFGEFNSIRDNRNSIQDKFRIAVTIAGKTDSSSDLVELAIISQETLQLIHQLRVLQFKDQEKHPWLKEISDQHSIEPFVAKEFSSIGWTIIFNREGTDMLELKEALKLVQHP